MSYEPPLFAVSPPIEARLDNHAASVLVGREFSATPPLRRMSSVEASSAFENLLDTIVGKIVKNHR